MEEAPQNIRALVQELGDGLPPLLKDQWLADVAQGLPPASYLESVPSALGARLLDNLADSVPASDDSLVIHALTAVRLVAQRIRERCQDQAMLKLARRNARYMATVIFRSLRTMSSDMLPACTAAMMAAKVAANAIDVLVNATKVDHRPSGDTQQLNLLMPAAEALAIVKIGEAYPEGPQRWDAYVRFAQEFETLVNEALGAQV